MDRENLESMLNLDTSIPKNNTPVPELALGLIVVCGATATGKSGLAIALAQRLNSYILSADSRQVYREFNIGTAKPTIAEQQRVPHYLIDLCDPTETLTVAEYQRQAQVLIGRWGGGEVGRWEGEETEGLGGGGAEGLEVVSLSSSPPPPQPPSPLASFPLLVGGTGLYIRSITKGLKIPAVPPHQELRSQLLSLGQTQCYGLLQQVDPASAVKIHANDPVRTVRSLEVFYVTGRPMSEQQGENPPSYPILQIGLDCGETGALWQRIERRTGQMVEMGLVQEVEFLRQKYGPDLPLLNTLGYAEFGQHLAGEISLAQAQELTVLHTRQFAKRQRTWFRGCPEIEWFDADAIDLLDQVWQRIQVFLSSENTLKGASR